MPAFKRNMLPPFSGLKCNGLGVGVVILTASKVVTHTHKGIEGGKEMESCPDNECYK
jgi:hypothetical protein